MAMFEGLDEGSRSFADYLRTSDHLRWARTVEKLRGFAYKPLIC